MQTETTNILEDYLDTVVVLPIEVKRMLFLMRELDAKGRVDLKLLQSLQEEHLQYITRTGKQDANLVKAIDFLWEKYNQNIEEKNAIADQMVEASNRNLQRLSKDTETLEKILQESGELLNAQNNLSTSNNNNNGNMASFSPQEGMAVGGASSTNPHFFPGQSGLLFL